MKQEEYKKLVRELEARFFYIYRILNINYDFLSKKQKENRLEKQTR
jgi:hypothetical protein